MRLSARAYAAEIGVHEDTVQSWCRNSMLPNSGRNKALPPIVARRIGRNWQINVEKTELAQSLVCGNPAERDIAKREMASKI
jgi:hypothetical protein